MSDDKKQNSVKDFKSLLKQKWQSLTPESRKKLTKVAISAALVVVSLVGYYTLHDNKIPTQTQTKQDTEIIEFQPGILQKSINNEVNHKIEMFQKRLEALQEQIKQKELMMSKQNKAERQENSKSNKQQSPTPTKTETYPTNYYFNKPNKPLKPEIIGSIGIASNANAESEINKHLKKKKKQEEETVYLPPSFMEASLLSGLDAPTMNGAQNNPVPVLLRVRAPAILPNEVKANLKGCFIIAEGVGNLASERVMLRLVSLSCIAKNGQAVIDQKVKGFVVDSDGKIGLRGRVVSKMGAVLARAALAGFLEGFGNAVNISAETTSVSALGTTTTINSSDITKAAAGKGIYSASKKLAEFYMKLANQTLPVIEIGATRRVTVVVSQGVKLKIRNVCIGGEKCD